MIRAKELIEFPVFSTDLKKIGQGKDILFDLKEMKVKSLIINCGRVFVRKKYLNYDKICSFETDKIIIKGEEDLFKKNGKYQGFNYNYIYDLEVKTENQELLGFINDIIIKKEDGKILGFVLTNGIFNDILIGINIMPAVNSINFQKKQIIVPEEVKKCLISNLKDLKNYLN